MRTSITNPVVSGGVAFDYLRTNRTRWTPQTSAYVGLVATRAKAPSTLNTGFKQTMMRSIHVARSDITAIGAAFANWYVGTSGLEGNSGDVCTIKASVEYPLGAVPVALTFSGQASGVCGDWQTLASDLAAIAIPSGSTFAIREFRSCGANGGIVYIDSADRKMNPSSGECFQYAGSGQSDLTGSGGTFANSAGDVSSFTAPVAVFGTTVAPSYGLIGDSRAAGIGDDGSQSLYCGELERSVGPVRAYTNLARSGEKASDAAGIGFAQRNIIIARYCTHIISNYGINDLYGAGQSAQTVAANQVALRSRFPNHWYSVVTVSPESNSSDGWSSTDNQTSINSSYDTARSLLNSLLRSQINTSSVFDSVFDAASIVESATGWKAPGYTADGLHGTPKAYAAIAASGIIVPA